LPGGRRATAKSCQIALLYAFIPSVSRVYWVFAAMATQVYFSLLVYAVLILAGILAIGILPPLLLDRLRKPG
jgi:hypothetical protein